MLNLAGYRVLTTYYYIPSMTWIEIYIIIWSYRPNELIKLKDAIYLLRQKQKKIIFHCLVHTAHYISMLTQINMLPLKSMFSKQKDQTRIKQNVPDDPASQNASVAVF